MSDHSELKRLAEAATPGPWQTELEYPIIQPAYPARGSIASALIWQDAHFIAAANPAAMLALIAEAERLTADNSSLRGSCAKLGVEHAGMVRIHRKANTEIRRLSAEVEALRKDAERYRWLREKVGVDLIFGDYNPWLLSCNTDMTDLEKKTTDAAIDAAMTKGSKP